MNESFSMRSRDGRREVLVIRTSPLLSKAHWELSLTKSTRTRTETRTRIARTKAEARQIAKEWIAA